MRTNKYLIMGLLDLLIVTTVFSISLHLVLIMLLDWANLTIPHIVGITVCTVWALSFLFNSKLWALKKAAVIGSGFVLATLLIAGTGCLKCTVHAFITAIAVMGVICIAAILAQVVIAKLISRDRAQNK